MKRLSHCNLEQALNKPVRRAADCLCVLACILACIVLCNFLTLPSALASYEATHRESAQEEAKAETGGWKLKASKDGVEVFTRRTRESRYHEFKAVTEIPASLVSLLSLLWDINACPRWLDRCALGEMLEARSSTKKGAEASTDPDANSDANPDILFYQITKMPFPTRSRDIVLRVTATTYDTEASPMKAVLLTMVATPEAKPKTRYLRIRKAKGTWLLEPLDDRTTRITWTQFADPGGGLPVWMVNRMLSDMPLKSLANLRELVKEEPYATATSEDWLYSLEE